MKSARKKDKFLILISLFQNLVDEKNRQRAESVINLTKKEAEINQNNQSKEDNKRKNKKNENKKNDSNENKKCFRCDRETHSKNECSAINSECSECHKIDY
jgi:predicted alpha/beta superfamily hydrolase